MERTDNLRHLYQGILDHPSEKERLLIFADALEEDGQVERAEQFRKLWMDVTSPDPWIARWTPSGCRPGWSNAHNNRDDCRFF